MTGASSRTKINFNFCPRSSAFVRVLLILSDPLRHQNIRLAETIRIGNDPNDGISTFQIEFVRMLKAILNRRELLKHIRINVHAEQRCAAEIVIAAEYDGERAAASYLFFKIFH